MHVAWLFIVVLLILWVCGVVFGVAGNFIHLLLIVAAVWIIIRLVAPGRPPVA